VINTSYSSIIFIQSNLESDKLVNLPICTLTSYPSMRKRLYTFPIHIGSYIHLACLGLGLKPYLFAKFDTLFLGRESALDVQIRVRIYYDFDPARRSLIPYILTIF